MEIIKKLIETAGLDAIKDWPEGSFIFFINMRKEHSLWIPVPDLLRAYINIFRIRIYIKKKLRRSEDLIDCVKRMLSLYYREKRNSVENKEERTRNPKEIPHHEVSSPAYLQLWQAVKNIEGILSFFFNDIMYIYGERLKAVC